MGTTSEKLSSTTTFYAGGANHKPHPPSATSTQRWSTQQPYQSYILIVSSDASISTDISMSPNEVSLGAFSIISEALSSWSQCELRVYVYLTRWILKLSLLDSALEIHLNDSALELSLMNDPTLRLYPREKPPSSHPKSVELEPPHQNAMTTKHTRRNTNVRELSAELGDDRYPLQRCKLP